MHQSLARLLGESVDYAGLIAPERPSAEEAVKRFLAHQSGPECAIVSRFICPANQLSALLPILNAAPIRAPFPVAVVGRATQTAAEWEDELAACAEWMNEFETHTPDAVEVAAFEIKPPPSAPELDVLRDLKGFSEVEVFIESPRLARSEALLAAAADTDWAFLKFDLTGSARPDSFAVAKLLHEAIAVELPFKIVQGSGDAITNAAAYGIFNLFGAVALGISEDLSSRELEAVLIDSDRAHWSFLPETISFRGWEADIAAIEQARDTLVEVQCDSIQRPLEELSGAGLWSQEGD